MSSEFGPSGSAEAEFGPLMPDISLRGRVIEELGLPNEVIPNRAQLSTLTELDLREVQWISSLEGLQHATNLKTLSLELKAFDLHGALPTEFGVLGELHNLRRLSISGLGTDFPDSLAAQIVRLPNLRRLTISRARHLDLNLLVGLKRIKVLSLAGSRVKDLLPLAAFRGLRSLDLEESVVADFSPLVHLSSLINLNLTETSFSDLSLLSKMPELRVLNVARTDVVNLEPLVSMKKLRSLEVSNNRIIDFGPLSKISSLWELDVTSTLFSDLRCLRLMANLQVLTAIDAYISDLGPLRQHPALTMLAIESRHLRDLSPLRDLKLFFLHFGAITLMNIEGGWAPIYVSGTGKFLPGALPWMPDNPLRTHRWRIDNLSLPDGACGRTIRCRK